MALTVLTAFAEGKFETKKYKISDFRHRTTYVVLPGNEMTDAMLRTELQMVWNLSPYEFCSIDEFNASKTNPENYFMVFVDSTFKNERHDDGVSALAVYKGSDQAKDGVDGLYLVASMPVCSAEDPDGREVIFMRNLIIILQDQISDMLQREFNVSSRPVVDLNTSMKKWTKRCAIAMEDMASVPSSETVSKYSDINIDFVDHAAIDAYVQTGADMLVGYVVAPEHPNSGAMCYCMLMDASTGELMYIVKRPVSIRKPKGFIEADLAAFSRHAPKK